MIGTVGSLVQETGKRARWLAAVSLYTVACTCTASLLGALIGGIGHGVFQVACGGSTCSWTRIGGALVVGLLALVYACSDLGFIRVPRPSVMQAVPVTWWRRWMPYKAALVYGATLGLGFTTRISFGSLYVLCAWCFFQGNLLSGALLMGTYGCARALALMPASWFVYFPGSDHQARLQIILSKAEVAQQLGAVVLLLLSIGVIGFSILP